MGASWSDGDRGCGECEECAQIIYEEDDWFVATTADGIIKNVCEQCRARLLEEAEEARIAEEEDRQDMVEWAAIQAARREHEQVARR